MEDLPEIFRTSGAAKIREKLQGISGGKILDVATGSGDFINALMKMLKDYDDFVGIEISEEDLKSAVKRFEGRARASVSTSKYTLKREC